MSARERLAAWLRTDSRNSPHGDQRPNGQLAIAYISAPLSRADLDEVYMDVVALAGQRAAVLGLHSQVDCDTDGVRCTHCFDDDGIPMPWPCPTVVALGGGQ